MPWAGGGRAQGLLIIENQPTGGAAAAADLDLAADYPHPYRPIVPPTPQVSYRIKELSVHARLVDQVAQVQVSQTFVNTRQSADRSGVRLSAALRRRHRADDARGRRQGICPPSCWTPRKPGGCTRKSCGENRDPALLEWLGTGLFRTNVFPVPPGAKRTVSLRYSQLCRKEDGLTDFLFPLEHGEIHGAGPREGRDPRDRSRARRRSRTSTAPRHAIEIKRPDERHAAVTSAAKRRSAAADFRLFYDVGRGKVSTRVLSYRPDEGQDGYFLLLATPEIKPADQEPAGQDGRCS